MAEEARLLPVEMIPQLAEAAARRQRTIAITLFAAAAVLALVLLLPILDPNYKWRHPDRKPVRGLVVLLVVACTPLVAFGVRALLRMRRARLIGGQASAAACRWYLHERAILAVDDGGKPRPELSLKISEATRDLIVAVPKATVASKSS